MEAALLYCVFCLCHAACRAHDQSGYGHHTLLQLLLQLLEVVLYVKVSINQSDNDHHDCTPHQALRRNAETLNIYITELPTMCHATTGNSTMFQNLCLVTF